MTLKEATEILRKRQRYCKVIANHANATVKADELREIEAIDIALTALRPVSREKVEKVWRGEWIPAESDFDDDDTLFDVDDWCDWQCSACHNEVCYDDPMERRWLPKFCPNCGAPMTDEAVKMVMERLNKLEETKK